MINFEQLTQTATEMLTLELWAQSYSLALLTLVIGFWVIKRVMGVPVIVTLESSQVEVTLRKFLREFGVHPVEGVG